MTQKAKRPHTNYKNHTKEDLAVLAKECGTRGALAKKYPGAHKMANLKGWLDDLFGKQLHYETSREHCAQAIAQCSSIKEVTKRFPGCSRAVYLNGWEDLWEHLRTLKPVGYWTYEQIGITIRSCTTIRELRENYPSAYSIAHRNGWYEKEISELTHEQKRKAYWTLERCIEAAKACETKREFRLKHPGAYARCLIMKWIDKVCAHMKSLGNLKFRAVYKYTLSNKRVYIGFTDDLDRRHKEHLTKSNISKLLRSNKYTYEILSDYLPEQEAIALERRLIADHLANGFELLNRSQGGELGPIRAIPYTMEYIIAETQKYDLLKDFYKSDFALYSYCQARGLLPQVTKHMKRLLMKNDEITFGMAKAAADKCSGRAEFKRTQIRYFSWAKRNGMYEEVVADLPRRAAARPRNKRAAKKD